MKIKKQVIERAIREARESDVARGKLGAVLFTNSGQILLSTHNRIFFGHSNQWTVHAEAHLISKALRMRIPNRYNRNDLNILVVRWKPQTNTIANSCPCEKCQYFIKEAGLRTFYTDSRGEIKEL